MIRVTLVRSHHAGIVSALGLTQIIGYGTLYYSFSILAPQIAADLSISLEQVFAVFSVSLFIGGLSAPVIGRQMDKVGAASVLTIGSVLSALTLVLCAWSPTVAVFAIGIILLEVSSGMVQYQAAFAALVENDPKSAPRNITYLTLIAGFASTIFWPISAALLDVLTWREIYVFFAALNLLLCMPLHFWIMRQGKSIRANSVQQAREHVVGAIPLKKRRKAMLIVSAAFAILGFTLSSILAHMVPMLGTLGLGAAAVLTGALFGPAQVASRLINMVFGSRLSPPMLAVISAALMVGGIVILGITGTSLVGAVAFAICLGLGSGINSIAQGSLPLYLFGSEGYGAVTGKMAAARLVAGAVAPFAFATALQQFGIGPALFATAAIGTLGLAAFLKVAVGIERNVLAARSTH